MEDQATRDKQRRHLDRLETLIDSEEQYPNLFAFFRSEGEDLFAPLIGDEIDDGQIRKTVTRILPEPLTALVTLACSPFGTVAWNLGWLAGPVIGLLVRRRRK